MSFYISSRPDSTLRLRSYSAITRGGKTLLKIEVESADPFAVAYALTELAEVQTGQRDKPKLTPKPKAAKVLALPAPDLALPKPGDHL